MNKNQRIISSLIILLFLIIGLSVVSASDDYQTSDTSLEKNTQTIQNNDLNDVKDDVNIKKQEKNVKTATKTVSTYNELSNALTTNDNNKIINMKKGVYTATKTITLSGKLDNITINGNGSIIDGQNKYAFLTFNGKRNITINNLTIRNTKSTNSAGAITMTGVSNLKLNNVNFTNNMGADKGGAITNRGSLTITNCVFTSNSAIQGGAIWTTGEYGGNTIIKNTKFINNKDTTKATHDRTGVIYALSGGDLNITKCLFENNQGRSIHNYKDSKATIANNTFRNTKLSLPNDTIRGGVIDNYEASMTLSNNTFMNINVTGKIVSGGILYHEIGKLTMENNVFNNIKIVSSQLTQGGILFNRNSTALVNNNTFNDKENSAKINGATLYNNIGTINVTNNTFNGVINVKGELRGSAYNDKSNERRSIINQGGNDFSNVKATATKIYSKEIYNLDIQNNITYPKKLNIKIAAPKTITTGQIAKINITVTEDNNKAVNTYAILKLNGITQKDQSTKTTLVNVTKGKASFSISLAGFSGKTFDVSVVAFDSNHTRSENTTKMTVLRGQYMLSPISINASSEEEVSINATVKDSFGNAISGPTQVAIKLGDRTVLTTKITDGKLNVKIKVPYLPQGENKFKITLGENYRYETKVINNTLNIHKQNVTATITKITAKAGEKITLKTKLTNQDTKTNVISGKFSYKIDGKAVTTNTTPQVSNAIAQLEYTLPSDMAKGVHTVTIVYAGNTQSNSLRFNDKSLTII